MKSTFRNLPGKSFAWVALIAVAIAAAGVAKSFHGPPVARTMSLDKSDSLDKDNLGQDNSL